MKNKKKAIRKNSKAINEFMAMYGQTTQKEMSEFLFDLQGIYLSLPGISWTDKGAADIACRFGLLYRLVNAIQPVK